MILREPLPIKVFKEDIGILSVQIKITQILSDFIRVDCVGKKMQLQLCPV